MRWNRNAALIILYVPHCTVKIPTIANSTHPIATGEEFLGLAGVKNQQWKGQHECCVILCQVYLKKVRTKVGGSPERYCIPRSNCSHSPFNNAAMECWVQTAMEYWICHLPLSTFWRWEGVLVEIWGLPADPFCVYFVHCFVYIPKGQRFCFGQWHIFRLNWKCWNNLLCIWYLWLWAWTNFFDIAPWYLHHTGRSSLGYSPFSTLTWWGLSCQSSIRSSITQCRLNLVI